VVTISSLRLYDSLRVTPWKECGSIHSRAQTFKWL